MASLYQKQGRESQAEKIKERLEYIEFLVIKKILKW